MDVVIEVKSSIRHYPTRNCHGDCYFFENSATGCRMDWATKKRGPLDGRISEVTYWDPTDKCLGPGRYRLVRVEEE